MSSTTGPDATVAVGRLCPVAVAGDPAPPELGRGYRRLRAGAVNDAGDVAYSVDLTDATAPGAVASVSGGEHQILARTGWPAANGARYQAFGDLDLGEGGLCLFHATLDGRAGEGLFLAGPARGDTQRVRPVAMTGGLSPAGHEYVAFHRPTITTWTHEGVPHFVLAFVARLADGRKTLVVAPSHAAATECLTTGRTLGEDVVADFVASRLGYALCCVATLRRGGRRYRKALIVDIGHIISGDRVRDGGVLPGYGRVDRVLAPAAVNVQMGFVAVRLAGGHTALVSRPPAVADPEVLVSTGDELPGQPGTAIGRLGPPVASSGRPNTGRFGVASAVRTADGTGAIWLGVFGAQHPLHGIAVTPLADGDVTDDGRGLAVRDLVPVQLTNSGVLLVRATVAAGSGHPGRAALLTLDGLFDWYTG